MDITFPTVTCEWVMANYQTAPHRGPVGQHLVECTSCVTATEPYFSSLRQIFESTSEQFTIASQRFILGVSQLAASSERKGTIDPSTAILVDSCNQLTDSAKKYYATEPHNNLRAIGWLPQAFMLCRFFESQRYVEKAGSFIHGKSTHVGKMLLDTKNQTPTHNTFGEVTSPSFMLSENLKYGTFRFNFKLQEQIKAEADSGKYVHALTLICDSPKHGVMSSILNMAATTQPEHLFAIGFGAGFIAIHAFCDANNI